MPFSKKYKHEAVAEIPAKGLSGKTAWSSPSNIALVKYWGKRSPQLPMNPSISFSLSQARTITNVEYSISKIRNGTVLHYIFDGKRNEIFEKRVSEYLKVIVPYMPLLKNIDLRIESKNTFPHSSGIASSASAFSALALALTEIEYKLKDSLQFDKEFYRKASFLARLGSGSACRSVYGGAVLWGETPGHSGSSNEIAISLDESVHTVFKDFRDVVIIIDKGKKHVSSSEGHALMNNHPFAPQRFKQAQEHTEKFFQVLKEGDLKTFVELVEYEALCLHAMMLSSFPGYFLLQASTIDVIQRIREYRAETDIPVSFTLDAGANVHLLFPASDSMAVMEFVNHSLVKFCVDGLFLEDAVGDGPVKI